MKNTLTIARKHQHGDVAYCIAMMCNYKRPLVPKPLAEGEEPQPRGERSAMPDEGDEDEPLDVDAEVVSDAGDN